MIATLLTALLAQSPADTFENTAAFEATGTSDGYRLSRRAVKGSVFSEYRVEVTTTHAVEALCVTIFEWGTRGADSQGLLLTKVLQDGDDKRVIYNQFSQPLVANRDYALTVWRERLPDGSCRVRFQTSNELAPPKPEGWVRMDRLWGEWHMAPRDGGTALTYTLFSDPAGAIPAFLVHGAQKNAALDAVKKGLAKVGQYTGGKK